MCTAKCDPILECWQNTPTSIRNKWTLSIILLFHLVRLGNSTGVGFWLSGNGTAVGFGLGGKGLRVTPLDLVFSWLRRKCLLLKSVKVGVQESPLSWESLAASYNFKQNQIIKKIRTLDRRQASALAGQGPCCRQSSSSTLSGWTCSTLEMLTVIRTFSDAKSCTVAVRSHL